MIIKIKLKNHKVKKKKNKINILDILGERRFEEKFIVVTLTEYRWKEFQYLCLITY